MPTIPDNIATIIFQTLHLEGIADALPLNIQKAIYKSTEIIYDAAQDCKRRPQHRSPAQSDPMTPAKRALIRAKKRASPNMSHQEIATQANVNMARVSETLYGKRK